MKPVFLDFEQPIAELTNKIDELRFVQDESAVDISDEIARLQKKSNELTKSIFSKLTPAQISQVSRHPQRPYTLDYINGIFTDFEELHGDRHYSDDHAIVGGWGPCRAPERGRRMPSRPAEAECNVFCVST